MLCVNKLVGSDTFEHPTSRLPQLVTIALHEHLFHLLCADRRFIKLELDRQLRFLQRLGIEFGFVFACMRALGHLELAFLHEVDDVRFRHPLTIDRLSTLELHSLHVVKDLDNNVRP